MKNMPKAIPYLRKILSTASFTTWRETWSQSNVAPSTRPFPDYSVLMKLIAFCLGQYYLGKKILKFYDETIVNFISPW